MLKELTCIKCGKLLYSTDLTDKKLSNITSQTDLELNNFDMNHENQKIVLNDMINKKWYKVPWGYDLRYWCGTCQDYMETT